MKEVNVIRLPLVKGLDEHSFRLSVMSIYKLHELVRKKGYRRLFMYGENDNFTLGYRLEKR